MEQHLDGESNPATSPAQPRAVTNNFSATISCLETVHLEAQAGRSWIFIDFLLDSWGSGWPELEFYVILCWFSLQGGLGLQCLTEYFWNILCLPPLEQAAD